MRKERIETQIKQNDIYNSRSLSLCQFRADFMSAINIKTTRWLLSISVIFFLLLAIGRILLLEEAPSAVLVAKAISFSGETTPFLFAVFAVFLATGDTSRSSIAYSLLAEPSRSKVFLWRCVNTTVLVAVASAIALILLNLSALLFSAFGQIHDSQSYLAVARSSCQFILLSVIYALLGTGIGFLFQRQSAGILGLIALVWGLPVVAAVLMAVGNNSLGMVILDWSPASLSSGASSDSQNWATSLFKFTGWSLISLSLSWFRFRRFSPS